MMFSAPKSPSDNLKAESSLLGLDFDVFTLSEYEEVGLSATQSPQNPSNASQSSEHDHSVALSPQDPPTPQLGSNLYVASLPETCTDAQLRQLFAPFGAIVSAKVMCRKGTHVCKGYGFVLFRREEDAAVAQASMIGRVVDGNKIQVRRAHTAACAPLLTPSKPSHRSNARAGTTVQDAASQARRRSQSQSQSHVSAVCPVPGPQCCSAFSTGYLPASSNSQPQSPQIQWSYPMSPLQNNSNWSSSNANNGYFSAWNPMMLNSMPTQQPTSPQVVYVVLPPMNTA